MKEVFLSVGKLYLCGRNKGKIEYFYTQKDYFYNGIKQNFYRRTLE